MNFIGRMAGPEIQVELKYCERCGGLWLRPEGTDEVYCASCHLQLASRPNPGHTQPRKARRRKARRQRIELRRESLQSPAQIDCLQGMAAIEVWA